MKDRKTEGAEMTPAASDTEEKRQKKKRSSGFALLLTQSVIVVAILLIGWVFRMIGGGAFDQLRTQLAAALTDNTFVESVLSLWVPPEDTTETPVSGNAVQTEPTAAGETPAASVCLYGLTQVLGERYDG